jgi:hypothetical protein
MHEPTRPKLRLTVLRVTVPLVLSARPSNRRRGFGGLTQRRSQAQISRGIIPTIVCAARRLPKPRSMPFKRN